MSNLHKCQCGQCGQCRGELSVCVGDMDAISEFVEYMCVCVCARARACVCVCLCVYAGTL